MGGDPIFVYYSAKHAWPFFEGPLVDGNEMKLVWLKFATE